jgi:hypothetical protein
MRTISTSACRIRVRHTPGRRRECSPQLKRESLICRCDRGRPCRVPCSALHPWCCRRRRTR